MLHPDRLQFESEIFKNMIYNIHENYFKSSETTFADLQAAGGQYVDQIVKRLREYGHSDENIKDRVFAFSENHVNLIIMKERNKNKPIVYKLYTELDEKNMNFDVIVINPPYKSGMHMDFLNKSFEILKKDGTLSIIHPSQPFLNNKPTQKRKRELKVLETINNNTSTLDLVNGNKLFDNIKIYVPLSITTIKKDGIKSNTIVSSNYMGFKNKESLENIESLTIHGNSKIVNSIKSKILKKSKSMVVEHLSPTRVDNKFYLNFNIIGGNIGPNYDLKDFYCPFYKAYENDPDKHILDFPKNSNSIQFDSYHEALNFFNYMKSKFSRFCISLCKINQNFHRGETSYLPYLNPSQKWDDDKCFDYFKLNKKEREFIKNYIGNWYDIDFE